MSFLSDYILTILVASIVILIGIIFRKRYNYFIERDIAFLKPVWKDFFYSLSGTYWKVIFKRSYDQANAEGRSYMGMFMFFLKPCFMMMDPSMTEKILIKDFSHFHDHGFDLDYETNPLAGHLFNMKGDQWRTLRHKLLPTFTSGKLKGMVPAMEECADALVNEMKTDASLTKDTNTKELFKRYTLAVIANCAFGLDSNSIKDPNCKFKEVLKEVATPNIKMQIRFLLLFWFPNFSKFFKIKFVSKEVEDFFAKLTKDSFEIRKQMGVKRNDFIQLLLELKEKGSVAVDARDLEQDEKETLQSLDSQPNTAKLELTDELLMAQVFVFMVAGFDNSGYVAAITNYMLSKHPEIQARVREEIKMAKDKYGGINYQSLREMKLLGACIDESLRLHSPIPMLFRECTKDYTLPDGKRIEKGSTIFIPASCIQSDSRYWPNPHDFKPDRFLNGDSILPGAYLPFGDGPRLCIAQRFALISTKVLLVKMMENFELLPSKKTKEPIVTKLMVVSDIEGGFWGNFKCLEP